jgi:hypothetical protein
VLKSLDETTAILVKGQHGSSQWGVGYGQLLLSDVVMEASIGMVKQILRIVLVICGRKAHFLQKDLNYTILVKTSCVLIQIILKFLAKVLMHCVPILAVDYTEQEHIAQKVTHLKAGTFVSGHGF